MTSATSYLAQAFNRTNLDVLVNTRVTKLIPVGKKSGHLDMRAVEFAQTADGTSRRLRMLLKVTGRE